MKTILDIDFARIRASWYHNGVKDVNGDNIRFLNESITFESALIYLKTYRDVENIKNLQTLSLIMLLWISSFFNLDTKVSELFVH